MAVVKIPLCRQLVENSAKHIYGNGYEVPCTNGHLEKNRKKKVKLKNGKVTKKNGKSIKLH